MRGKSDQVPLAIMELTNDTRDSKARGIDMEMNREFRIEATKDGSGGKTVFEFVKCFLSLRRPVKMLILVKES